MAYFINEEHQERYEKFLAEANVEQKEYTKQAVLYLLSSVQKVSDNMNRFFVLKGGYINPDEAEKEDLSTGEKLVVGLAFNLFNGYESEEMNLSPYYVLSWLDSTLRKVYVEALEMKMGSN